MFKMKLISQFFSKVILAGLLNFVILSPGHSLQIIVQETIEKPNSELKMIKQEMTFPIFEFVNDHWVSTQSKISSELDVEGRYDKKKERVAVFSEILEWTQKNPIDVKNLTLLKKSSYEGWEGNKEVKVFTSKIQKSNVSKSQNKNQSEHWRKRKPSLQLLDKLYSEFRKQFPMNSGPWSVNWKKSDLEIGDAYQSSKGNWLISLRINHKKLNELKEPPELMDENIGFNYQFYAVVNGTIKHLGEGLHPILAADFAGNGQSDWLMAYTGYNREGYILFDPNFSNFVSFKYLFH